MANFPSPFTGTQVQIQSARNKYPELSLQSHKTTISSLLLTYASGRKRSLFWKTRRQEQELSNMFTQIKQA